MGPPQAPWVPWVPQAPWVPQTPWVAQGQWRRGRRRTGDNWTTWLPSVFPGDTVRNRVTVPPPGASLFPQAPFQPEPVTVGRPGCRQCSRAARSATGSPFRHQIPAFSLHAATTRTGGRWTTWLPPVLLDGTVRNRVTIPPSVGDPGDELRPPNDLVCRRIGFAGPARAYYRNVGAAGLGPATFAL